MDAASIYYLGVTMVLCVIFGAIVARLYSPRRKKSMEEAKYRMLEDDDSPPHADKGTPPPVEGAGKVPKGRLKRDAVR